MGVGVILRVGTVCDSPAGTDVITHVGLGAARLAIANQPSISVLSRKYFNIKTKAVIVVATSTERSLANQD